MSHTQRYRVPASLVLAALLLVVLAALPWDVAAATPQASIEQAWRRALSMGTYRYDADVVQVVSPLPTLANVGLSSKTSHLAVAGTVDLPRESLQMKIWRGAGSAAAEAGLELEIEDGVARGRAAGGAWEPVQDVSGIFAPGQDLLGYLAAATNVRRGAPALRAGISYTPYQFDLSGPAFGAYLRDRLEQALRRQGRLPAGARLAGIPGFDLRSGRGELWVGADGLPLRQVIELTMRDGTRPEQVEATITTDFSGFEAAPLPRRLLHQLGLSSARAAIAGAGLALLLFGLAALGLLALPRRRAYAIIAYGIAGLLLALPLLNLPPASAASGARPPAEQAAPAAPAPPESSYNPFVDPLANPKSDLDYAPAPAGAPGVSAVDDGGDKDGDRLTDAREKELATDPQQSDSDKDGLSDGVEVYELGTSPLSADSDGDLLSDKDEVTGFRDKANRQWYLNPFSPDSNGDGRIDSIECLDVTACGDTDADGTPDAFDDDDDGDGVPDAVDEAPTEFIAGPRGQNGRLGGLNSAGFKLQLNNYTPGKPLVVGVQLRPVNPTHLWYTLNVLDWPDNDNLGQIQRMRDDTFGASGKDGNGDMRLVPMLEVEIPAAEAARTLPLKPGITGMPGLPAWSRDKAEYAKQQADWLASWLDQDLLRSFGLTVRIKNEKADLIVIAPLGLVYDTLGEHPVAFTANIVYRPVAGSFGAGHSMRLVWLVNGKLDSCTDPPAASAASGEEYNFRHYSQLPAEQRAKEPYKAWSRKSDSERYDTWCADAANWSTRDGLLHSYYDDWYLTGLDVREDQGVEAAVIFQKPEATSGGFPQHLWNLARNLDRTFIAGQSDMTLDVIKARFDSRSNGGASDQQRWGLPREALTVESYTFGDQAALAGLGQKQIPALLDNYFRTGSSARLAAPTLLLIRAERYRRAALELGSPVARWSTDQLTVDLSSASVPVQVLHGMSWAPYRLSSAGAWELYPSADYYQSAGGTFTQALQELNGELSANADRLAGAVALARSYLLALVAGSVRIVSSGGVSRPLFAQAPGDGALALDGSTAGAALAASVKGLAETLISANAGSIARLVPSLSGGNSTHTLLEAIGKKLTTGTSSEALSLVKLAGRPPASAPGGQAGLSSFAAIDGIVVSLDDGLQSTGGVAKQLKYMRSTSSYVEASGNLYTALSEGQKTAKHFLDARKATAGAKAAAGAAKSATTAAQTVGKASRFGGAFGIVTAVGVPVASFVWQAIQSGMALDSLQFTQGLADVTAQIIVGVFLTVLSSIVPIGTLVVAALALIDLMIMGICKLTGADESDSTIVKDWLCAGVTQLLTRLVTFLIFSQDPLVDLGKGDRITPANWKVLPKQLSGASGSFQVGNYLDVSADVITTLHAKVPYSPLTWAYSWMYLDPYVRDSTFRYAFTAADEKAREQQEGKSNLELHELLDLHPGSMPKLWHQASSSYSLADPTELGNLRVFTGTQQINSGKLVQFSSPGINWRPSLYLAEGYSVRAVECWGIVPLSACYFRETSDSTYLDLKNSFAFDIFPETLDKFYALSDAGGGAFRLAWDAAFPALKDADGDGLRSRAVGGVDPSDNAADSDGDGLGDYYELNHAAEGFDPNRPDTDGDGLSDYDELRLQSSPMLQDSDADGVSDKEERDGWEIVYAYDSNNQPLSTRIASDPNRADSDGDGLGDGREKLYGFNPRAFNETNLLTIVSTLDENDGVADGIVAPGRLVQYTATIANQLRNRYALGLFEVELPAQATSSSLLPRVYTLSPGTSTIVSGKVQLSKLTTTQKIELINRAGASIADLRSAADGRVVWLYFNENVGAKVFNDTSLLGNSARCGAGGCPEAGAEGYSGRGARFSDGASLEIPTSDGLGLGVFTVGLWVKPQRAGRSQTLVARGGNFTLELPADSLKVRLRAQGESCGADAVDLQSSADLVEGQWSHVLASYDRTNLTLYLNGAVAATRAFSSGLCQKNARITIGQGGSSLLLDELSVYNRGLSGGEVLSMFHDPVLQLKFNGSLRDSSALRVPTSSGGKGTIIAGGSRASFDQTHWLNVGPSPALDLSSGGGRFTYSFRINPDSTGGRWLNMLGRDDGNQTYPSIYRKDRRLKVEFGSGSARCTSGESDEILTLKRWQQVIVTFTGTQFIYYVDGRRADSKPLNDACSGARPAAGQSFYVGRTDSRAWLTFEKIDVWNEGDDIGNAELYLKVDDERVWYGDDVDAGDTLKINKTIEITGDRQHRWQLWEEDEFTGDDLNWSDDFYVYEPAGSVSSYYDNDGWGDIIWKLSNNDYIGDLDDLRLYRFEFDDERAWKLSEAQVRSLILGFDEPPGARLFRDRSGNNLSATCADPNCPDSGIPGRSGQSLRFSKDLLTVAHQEALSPEDGLSLALWVRPDAGGGTQTIIAKRGRVDGKDMGYTLGLEGGKLRAAVWTADGKETVLLGPSLPAGQWTHVAMAAQTGSADGGRLTLYVNGAKAAEARIETSATLGDSDAALMIGGDSGGGPAFAGSLDDLRLFVRSLGGDEVAGLYSAAPLVSLSLDDDLGATSFANAARSDRPATCSGSACPKAGVKGQMREAALFDGADDSLSLTTGDPARLTTSLWVMPGSRRTQPQVLLAGESGGRRTMDVLLNPDLTVGFGMRKAGCGEWTSGNSKRTLLPEQWNHIATTFDGSTLRLYLNGTFDGELAVGERCRGGDLTLRLGKAYDTVLPLKGSLDEVQLFGTALDAEGIKTLFGYQFAWYDVAIAHELTVDADKPTVRPELADGTVLPRGDLVVAAVAVDATSDIARVEYNVGGGWRAAAPDKGVWVFTVSPNADGRMTVNVRAFDNVGNSAEASRTVIIDGTAPTVAVTPPPALQRALPAGSRWTVHLGGTASDPGRGAVKLKVTVSDANGATIGQPMAFASVQGGWEGDYVFSFAPNGAYKVEAVAVDAAGNRSTAAATLFLDTTPPTGDVTVGSPALSGTGASLPTLRGTATDLPLPVAPSLALHFEEPSGLASFHAGGPGQLGATCDPAACPAREESGQLGSARAFDGADDTLALPLGSGKGRPFTLAAWVRTGQENADTIFSARLGAADALQVAVTNGGDRLNVWADIGGWRAVGGAPLDEGVWNHIAVTYDGAVVRTYVDGALAYTFDEVQTPFSGFDRLWIGSMAAGNDFLRGSLDEVQFYSRALDAGAIRTQITALSSGVRSVEVGLLHAQYHGNLNAISWQPATVERPDQPIVSWSYPLPAGLEGPYQVYLRVTDAQGARATVGGGWTGEIDTLAPRVSLDYIPLNESSARVRCVVDDLNLGEAGFVCPAPPSEWRRAYLGAGWYGETFAGRNSSNIAQPPARRLSRIVAGYLTLPSPDKTIAACDTFGNCSSVTVDPAVAAMALEGVSAVISPTLDQVFTTLDPLPVTVYSRADAGLGSLAVTIGGATVHQRSWTGGEVEAAWGGSFTPPAEGLYPIQATLLDRNSAVITDTGQPKIYVDLTAPAVSLDMESISALNTTSAGIVTVSGLVTEATALSRLQLRLDEGEWLDLALPTTPAVAQPFTTTLALGLDGVVDGRTYTITLRAVDVAGREAAATRALLADMAPPALGALAAEYQAAGGIATVGAGGTITATHDPALTLRWEPASDTSGISAYMAGWSSSPDAEAASLTAYGPGATTHTAATTDATRLYGHLVAVDTLGNRTARTIGPIFVDHGLTPAYVSMDEYGAGLPYRGHMLDQCSLVGIDSRAANAGPGGALPAQKLYATWSAADLRLTWSGGSWDSDGDLFIYLDTASGGSAQLYNPYAEAITITLPLKGGNRVEADYLAWVKDAQTADLLRWDGGAWLPVAGAWDYRFALEDGAPLTDLRLPFAALAIADPATARLSMLAVASDEGALRPWATIPASSKLSSARVNGETPGLLYRALEWSKLGLDTCPNGTLAAGAGAGTQGAAPLFTGADVSARLTSDGPAILSAVVGDNALASEEAAEIGAALAALGDGDTISYTLSLKNRGSGPALGLSALITTSGGLRLHGSPTRSAGDLAAGDETALTFQASVDKALAHADGRPWAELHVTVFDATGSADEGWIDQLKAAHQVDFDPPHYAAAELPVAALRPGPVTLGGVVADASPVPTIDLEIQVAGSTTSVSCADPTPGDGAWECQADLSGAPGGATGEVRARGTDGHGQTGAWGPWRSFVVDGEAPTVALSDETALAVSDGIVGPAEATLSGAVSDNRGVDQVLVCDSDQCSAADLTFAESISTTVTVSDQPAAPVDLAGAACPGGITREFVVAQPLTVRDVRLGLLLAGADRGSIAATLRAPGGAEVLLAQRGGTRFGRDYSLTFDDSAPLRERDDASTHDLAQPFAARVAPYPGLLSSLTGTQAQGTWQLRLCGDGGEYREAWLELTSAALPTAQAGTWRYTLPIPEGSDGVAKRLRIYAVDRAGTSGEAGALALALKLDNVAPTLELGEVLIDTFGRVVVEGRGRDGTELSTMRVVMIGQTGEPIFEAVDVTPLLGAGGRYTGFVALDEQGSYTLSVEAQDAAGNLTQVDIGERSWRLDERPTRLHLPMVYMQ